MAVKQHFGAKAQADVRAKLGRGEVALLFVGQTKQQWEEACNLGVPGNVAAFKCFQVSVHSYSPWLSTYQRCGLNACNEELATPPMTLALNLSMDFFNQLFMLDEFDLQLRWRVAIYIAQESGRLIPVSCPKSHAYGSSPTRRC